jgi:hypothetical protein
MRLAGLLIHEDGLDEHPTATSKMASATPITKNTIASLG